MARVRTTQGRRGEVAIELHSDVPGRFQPGMRVFALGGEASRRRLEVEDAWPHKNYWVVKFAGIDSISEAEKLAGAELQVPRSERALLPPGAAYVSDLVGCMLVDHGRELGTVRAVRFGAGEAPLLVVGSGAGELEIPYAQEFLSSIELDRQRIEMLLPAGLLDINAPLSEEEKKQQAESRRARQSSRRRVK